MTFQLDTSGAVQISDDDGYGMGGIWRWPDLNPFTQGYVEALLRDADGKTGLQVRHVKFSDLAPATLARTMADCGLAQRGGIGEGRPPKASGRKFWTLRQSGASGVFPPLTPYLGDDGLIYLR